jgi:hypothetical protein
MLSDVRKPQSITAKELAKRIFNAPQAAESKWLALWNADF